MFILLHINYNLLNILTYFVKKMGPKIIIGISWNVGPVHTYACCIRLLIFYVVSHCITVHYIMLTDFVSDFCRYKMSFADGRISICFLFFVHFYRFTLIILSNRSTFIIPKMFPPCTLQISQCSNIQIMAYWLVVNIYYSNNANRENKIHLKRY